jgi:hypothetical protein
MSNPIGDDFIGIFARGAILISQDASPAPYESDETVDENLL